MQPPLLLVLELDAAAWLRAIGVGALGAGALLNALFVTCVEADRRRQRLRALKEHEQRVGSQRTARQPPAPLVLPNFHDDGLPKEPPPARQRHGRFVSRRIV